MNVSILAEMPDGNVVVMQILRVNIIQDELVQVIVAYEAMADLVRNREMKRIES